MQISCRRMQSALACAESQMPVLAALRARYGEKWTAAYLSLWIDNVQKFFNISAKMNGAQVTETAYMILDDFWALNLADVNLVFANAKRGQYGQLYGRIDGSIVYGWFQTYFDDRCNACENHSIREAETMSSNHPITEAQAKEFIRKVFAEKKAKESPSV